MFKPADRIPHFPAAMSDLRHLAATGLAKQAEREYRARDAAMPGVTQALRDARDLLLVANRDNPKSARRLRLRGGRLAPGKSQTQIRALNQRVVSRAVMRAARPPGRR
jgi:hypothetical protein